MVSSLDPLGILGTTISAKYDVDRLVEENERSVVYRATHRIWQQPVSLKCFKAWDLPREQHEVWLEQFIRQGARMNELSRRCASIVQARDVGTFDTSDGRWVPYLVLEWLEGKSLQQLMSPGSRQPFGASRVVWSIADAMRVLEPVAVALDLAHRQGISHGDLKPDNVFILGALHDPDMVVKLLDFGVIHAFASAVAPGRSDRAHDVLSPHADVRALAEMLAEMLAGSSASSVPGRRPTPRTLGASVSDEVEGVCARAIGGAPTEGYRAAGELWDALRNALGLPPLYPARAETLVPSIEPRRRGSIDAQSAALTLPSPSRAPTEAPPKRRGGTVAAALLVVGCFAAAGVWAGGRRGSWMGGASGVPADDRLGPNRSSAVPPAPSPAAPNAAAPNAASPNAASPSAASPSAASPNAASPSSASPCPLEMVAVPGGKFFMGDDAGGPDDRPAHQVLLSPYCIDRNEVTVASYRACAAQGACLPAPRAVAWKGMSPHEGRTFSTLCNGDDGARDTHPVNCVDWSMAERACAWAHKRLPTEAEWEYAARGPDGRRYPWGDEEPDPRRLNACGSECVAWGAKNGVALRALYPDDDGHEGTAPVGSFPAGASPFGVLDVVGNVWEWTRDWDGPYAREVLTDPGGPPTGTRRVVRGGAYNGAYASWVRPTRRYSDDPEARSHAYGFRCARPQGHAADH